MVVQVMKIGIIRSYNYCLSSAELDKAISKYNADFGDTFSYTNEGDHYHLTCKAASNYYYLGN
jgi:hypothetical protein